MKLTQLDVENLDKIIYSLPNSNCDTIPEIIDGWEQFPSKGDPNDETYRFYEDFLVDNNFCSVKDGWTPNSTISGFKPLQLASQGRSLILNEGSVLYYISDKTPINLPTSINITGNNNIIGQGNVLENNTKNSIIAPDSLKTVHSAAGTQNLLKRIWKILSNNPLISALVAGLIVAFISYIFNWI